MNIVEEIKKWEELIENNKKFVDMGVDESNSGDIRDQAFYEGLNAGYGCLVSVLKRIKEEEEK